MCNDIIQEILPKKLINCKSPKHLNIIFEGGSDFFQKIICLPHKGWQTYQHLIKFTNKIWNENWNSSNFDYISSTILNIINFAMNF